MGLREAAGRMGLHFANLSKVERGVWKPPMSHKVVLRVLQGLGLREASEDGRLLVLLAAGENGRFPKWVKEDEALTHEVLAFIWKRRAR